MQSASCSPPQHSRVLPLDAAGAATSEGAGQREVDVLLAVNTDHEGGHIDDLLANTADRQQRGDAMSETVHAMQSHEVGTGTGLFLNPQTPCCSKRSILPLQGLSRPQVVFPYPSSPDQSTLPHFPMLTGCAFGG